MTRLASIALTGALVFLAGCKDGITAPKCDRCDEMQVLTGKGEYRNGAQLTVSISNRTTAPMRYDWCALEMVGRTSSDTPFSVRYQPSKRCGFGAGVEEVLAHMVTVPPGQTVQETLNVPGAALQGEYRVHVWLVDENGVLDGTLPVVSNIFDVFPAAERALGDKEGNQ